MGCSASSNPYAARFVASVSDYYQCKEKVGAGAYGEVWLATENATGELFALKFMRIDGAIPPIPHPNFDAWACESVAREVQCSVELGEAHVNIVRPHELLLTRDELVLVTEYQKGGTLLDFCVKNKVDECLALYLFSQLISALDHCHAKGIVYRDVKLENTLLDGNDPPVVQLCDFGVARRANGEGASTALKRMGTVAGTPGFVSPQVLQVGISGTGTYDGAKADVWSAGIVLFVMLIHELPFDGGSFEDSAGDGAKGVRESMRKAYKAETQSANGREKDGLAGRVRPRAAMALKRLSKDCVNLLESMLDPSEETRCTMHQVKEHPWFRRELPAELRRALTDLDTVQEHIDEYGHHHPRYCHRDGDKLIEELVLRALLPRASRSDKVQRLALTWALLPHDNVAYEHGTDAHATAQGLDELLWQNAPPKSRPGFMQDVRNNSRGLRVDPSVFNQNSLGKKTSGPQTSPVSAYRQQQPPQSSPAVSTVVVSEVSGKPPAVNVKS